MISIRIYTNILFNKKFLNNFNNEIFLLFHNKNQEREPFQRPKSINELKGQFAQKRTNKKVERTKVKTDLINFFWV